MNLTDTQRQAIAHTKGNLQLIACAGSGKTEVVARFVSNLLNPATEPQVAPANIIAFTFTEKAAAELKERIVTRCREENGNLPGLVPARQRRERRIIVFRPQVFFRMPVSVQAAHPLRFQRPDP